MRIATGAVTVVDILRRRAREQPDAEAFTFVLDGETREESLTYAELDARARALGARLQQLGLAGDRVLLLCPAGLDYVAGLFACMYSGLIAVPAYEDTTGRGLEEAGESARASQPRLGISTGEMLPRIGDAFPAVQWLIGDAPSPAGEYCWREPKLEAESIAYLVYTSGSTSTPKGVMVTHGNLLHSTLDVAYLDSTQPQRIVNWAAPRAAGALCWGMVQPVVSGIPATHMAPERFAERPARWPELMSRTRATWCTLPNFAYDLAVESCQLEERRALDLSSWRYAWNGGDQVRADTIERFEQAFAPSRLRRGTIHTAYGMSEAAGISWNWSEMGPRVVSFDRAKLQDGVAAPTAESDGRVLVSQGSTYKEQQLAIVDPVTLKCLEPGRVGEIWTAGPHVSSGYWNQPEETRRVFHAHLATGEGPFLRTGDLGFMYEEELYIAGRLTEVIAVRGRKLYPHDLESSAEGAHAALKSRSGAAFALDRGGREELILVQEVDPTCRDLETVARSIRQRLGERFGVQPDRLVLVPPGVLPTTPTGKVSRSACRMALLADGLTVLHLSGTGRRGPDADASAPTLPVDGPLAYIWTDVLGPNTAAPDANFFALGGDSLQAGRLLVRVREAFGVELPLAAVFDAPTLGELERVVEERRTEAARPVVPRLQPRRRS